MYSHRMRRSKALGGAIGRFVPILALFMGFAENGSELFVPIAYTFRGGMGVGLGGCPLNGAGLGVSEGMSSGAS